ncbi:hypothetical protein PGTUg99_001119 [Puccinia graminis f. sp. tritici]|uniref:Uncharacterized protein n=1 Tax=Puccinia graminis f. sp. tritici TaxID=56615 RepID=A0A5B0N301_PUCGR|nr:hypothetical protein PGTUg99_034384 [Puccinia graminis f. sp. tritici]KAA1118290.1 hypothetical protein PGTUg99_001119 [Puccinia graminis f. sp. tritici]
MILCAHGKDISAGSSMHDRQRLLIPLICYLTIGLLPCCNNTVIQGTGSGSVDDLNWAMNNGLTSKASWSSSQPSNGLEVEFLSTSADQEQRKPTLETLNLFPLLPTPQTHVTSKTYEESPPPKRARLMDPYENHPLPPEKLRYHGGSQQMAPSSSTTPQKLRTTFQFVNPGPIASRVATRGDLANSSPFLPLHPSLHHLLGNPRLTGFEHRGKEAIAPETMLGDLANPNPFLPLHPSLHHLLGNPRLTGFEHRGKEAIAPETMLGDLANPNPFLALHPSLHYLLGNPRPTGFEHRGKEAIAPETMQGDLANPNPFLALHPSLHYLLGNPRPTGFEHRAKGAIGQDASSHRESDPAQPYFKVTNTPHAFEGVQKTPLVAPTIVQVESLDAISWEKISKRYSCQILAWNPSHIEVATALSAHAMVNEFLKKVIDLPSFEQLNQMHGSHMILIPFLYKLRMKPLTEHNWQQVIEVWRRLWRVSDLPEFQPIGLASTALSADHVLKKYLWISDFILESTIPQLYQDSQLKFVTSSGKVIRKQTDFKLNTPVAKVIKYLSDGRSENTSSSIIRNLNPEIERIAVVLNREAIVWSYNVEDAERIRAPWPNGIQPAAPLIGTVLSRLKSTAELINKPISHIVAGPRNIEPYDWTIIQDFLVKGLLYKHRLEDREIEIKLCSLPEPLQRQVQQIHHIAELDQARQASSSSPLETSDGLPLKYMIVLLDRELLNSFWAFSQQKPAQYEETNFLPQKIHKFFADRFSQRLMT